MCIRDSFSSTSVFDFSLRICYNLSVIQLNHTPAHIHQKEGPYLSQLLNLIIVDDEAFMRENLQSLFPWEELGYTVSAVFSNGSEALESLKKMPADVVLTDISMPVMDGIGLMKNIRELGIPTEVVFLSAYSDFEYARQGILYGAVDYLVKPVRYQELVDLFTRIRESIILKKSNFTACPASESDAIISRLSGCIRENAASVTLESVSYTHLDVDKRQLQRWPASLLEQWIE